MKILNMLLIALFAFSNLEAQQCVQNPIIVSKDTVEKLISDVAKAETERIEWSKEVIKLREEMNARLDSIMLTVEANKCVPVEVPPPKKNLGTFLKEWGPYITSGILLAALIYHHKHVHKDIKEIQTTSTDYPKHSDDDDDDDR